ncbi:unnamed protein product [Spirodela intermedia]|uniref:Uncharacterized protein n=1 Tax=Spirodela intermedia TaxID=51605 RepID=A0A7I8JQG3_SPIIN|nr:unnamed protein product [Spirodela intermedia]CAA6672001.1 unnamed protein product [Spirodela intermedia]
MGAAGLRERERDGRRQRTQRGGGDGAGGGEGGVGEEYGGRADWVPRGARFGHLSGDGHGVPGFLHQTPRFASSRERYQDVRRNVDRLKLIQLGFSFFGDGGRRRSWQISFRDFDVASPSDARSEASVELLKRRRGFGQDSELSAGFHLGLLRLAETVGVKLEGGAAH